MPNRKFHASVHQEGKLWVLRYETDPASTLTNGIRNEVGLKSTEVNKCPQRGVIKRIVVELVSGGDFDIDIVDKAFGSSVTPDSFNVIYSESSITDFTNKTEEIPFELERTSLVGSEGIDLCMGITPASGGGVFRAKVFIESRE